MFGYTSVMLGVYGVGHHKDVKNIYFGFFYVIFYNCIFIIVYFLVRLER